ncbi:MAG: YlxR family protein [Cyanobacteria bacterium J06600_6]
MNHINYRQCVSCRKVAPKQSFWRVVRVASTREVVLDRGMGRSAYLCPTQDCLTQARRKKRLQGALRTKVTDNIYQNLQKRLS